MTDVCMEKNCQDRRLHPRTMCRNRVAVTVISAPEAPQIESRTYYCWTHDLSASGLRFSVHTKVPVGAILKLEIIFDTPREVFRHIGKVVWQQACCDEGVMSSMLGVHITETLGGDVRFSFWRHCIEYREPEGE